MTFYGRVKGLIYGVFDFLKTSLNKGALSKQAQVRFSASGIQPITDVEPVTDFGGARTSIPSFSSGGGVGGSLPRLTQLSLGLSEARLKGATLENLVDILSDAHPDFGFALWNFLRLGNSGYGIKCFKVGSGKPYPQGEKDLDEFIQRLSIPNAENFEFARDFDKVVNQLLLSTITRGAASVELVLFPGYDDVGFLAPVDPATLEFKFENDRYIPYQDNGSISLDIPTFFYQDLDARIDDPYGRSPLLGALNTVMFQLQVLEDIKAVVHNQGYPRFDITILEEVLLQRMPINVRNNEEAKSKWLNERLLEIIDMYKDLNPDDAFVHFNSVGISTAGGGGKNSALIDPGKLMGAVDNLIMSGLKTLSTILGRRSTGNTESFAKMEIKLYLAGLRGIQQVVEQLLSKVLTMCLNIRGKQALVQFRFKPVEIRTDLEQEQMKQIKFLNLQFAYNMGWIDQNEAANVAVGHDPVSEVPLDNITPTNKEGDVPSGSVDENSKAGGNDDVGNVS